MHPAQWVGMEYREKYMRRVKGKCDIFFGIEHGSRKEEMEEQFNKEAKEGWRFAADAARITDENVGDEDRKHAERSLCSRGQQPGGTRVRRRRID